MTMLEALKDGAYARDELRRENERLRGELAGVAARVRAAGCLADSGDYGGACWVIDGETGERRLARTPDEHDPMCPQALAAAIEEGKP